MKEIKSVCLSFLVFAGATVVASGQQVRTSINPALTYYRAFELAPDLSAKDRDYLYTNEWRGQKLPDRFGELVAQYDSEFRLLHLAANATAPCDWGVDWSDGPGALIPQFSRIKATANAARLRAMWDLQHFSESDACDDLQAALALGRNGTRDNCLIGTLVEIAVERSVCATVAENFHQFSPKSLQRFADAFNAPGRGTIAACIPLERSCIEQWMVNRVLELQAADRRNGGNAMEELQRLYGQVTSDDDGPDGVNKRWQQIVSASGGTTDGVIKLLRETDSLYPRLEKIESLPPAQYAEQMSTFTSEMQGSTNPFIHEFFSALCKCRPREFAALADMAMVQAALQYKLHGEPGLRSVANPCGTGPFTVQRFIFDGVDRGFELNASCEGLGYPEVLIFEEKDGPPFLVFGKNAGKPPAP